MEAMTIPFFSGGTTNTAGVLEFLRENMFTSGQGNKKCYLLSYKFVYIVYDRFPTYTLLMMIMTII